MKGGRKNLKRAVEEQSLTLSDGHSIMQVLSLRGSNLIEVMDAQGEKSLALFPAKFSKSMWIKRGSFVVVDASEKDKVLESGGKVACIVSQVLFFEQVRALRKSPEWPEIFKSTVSDEPCGSLKGHTSKQEENENDNEHDSSDDDGLPPLEANMNRMRPSEWQSEAESDSDTDSGPDS
ncbi:putative RNA-binding protein EIF1AD [Rosa sericea]